MAQKTLQDPQAIDPRSQGPRPPLFVFLASNESRFVTGEVYAATGGQTPF